MITKMITKKGRVHVYLYIYMCVYVEGIKKKIDIIQQLPE